MSRPKSGTLQEPVPISDSNLSRAWARLFLRVHAGAGTEISPLILTLTQIDADNTVEEDATVRETLDQLLLSKGRPPVEDVAFTIFPQRLWEISASSRARFFDLSVGHFRDGKR